ncbi:Aspartate/glutamate/uridylate kinase [Sesbania bispinosa]|nr:Aspartate/glutamate/uridylate kinase [Sesbania bispinosa]
MASMTQLGWVKSMFPAASRRTLHCQPLFLPCRIGFAACVAPVPLVSCVSVRTISSKKVALRVSCRKETESDMVEKNEGGSGNFAENEKSYTCVMKFGGSSVASAQRMIEVANLILSFPEERPIIVLSAMGKTTNMLLLAGEKAVSCGVTNANSIDELSIIKDLHLRTVEELGVERDVIAKCMSTRIFAAYLNKIGLKARQYDAFEIGFITTDDFTNADILEATYPAVAKRLHGDWISDPAIPIVTGFLGKARKSCAVTTLGRGGSDLTATTIGKALGLPEIQVWKDVDGVLTCDPNICPQAEPVPYLTFDEAAELAYFGAQVLHPQSMRPAREVIFLLGLKILTTLKLQAILTSIVLKRNVTMLDIVSTRMLGQFGFLAKVFSIFEDLGISVDVVATSEVSISLTLDPSKLWSRELIQQELDYVVEELEKIAVVNLLKNRSIISLIGNVQRPSCSSNPWGHCSNDLSSHEQWLYVALYTWRALRGDLVVSLTHIQALNMMRLSANLQSEAEQCVRALHKAFFESELSELENECTTENGSVPALS